MDHREACISVKESLEEKLPGELLPAGSSSTSAGRQVSYGMYSTPANTVCSTNNVLYVSWN
jgi:hypothetical protein